MIMMIMIVMMIYDDDDGYDSLTVTNKFYSDSMMSLSELHDYHLSFFK